ncbi:unnamed protein product [Broad bean necrosis virus]|uniref:Triple-gene-block second protein n=1 Tax=Broad bean necrosis virus TaxID=79918 RepID=Q9YPH2_9VIRU|nr:unnamed protein product [Broad bean necrosis virus]BAA34697.1 unnamed protein product [Broad bean necrosis virus]
MVRSNEIGSRPNKYWPILFGVSAICFFLFLGVTNQNIPHNHHGDNIHKFSNGGKYQDGTKRINYNANNSRAYNGSSSNNQFKGLFLPALLFTAAMLAFQWFSKSRCPVTCRGDCANCQ